MNIDSILDTGGVRTQTRITRYDVDWAPCWGTKWYNEDDIETSEIAATDDDLTYDQLVQLKTPIHYYRLGEASTATPPDDEGSLNQAGTWGADTIAGSTGLLTGDLNKAAQFGGFGIIATTRYVNVANFKIPCLPVTGPTYTGYVEEFTQEFLINLDASFTGKQYIMGQVSSTSTTPGYDYPNGFGGVMLSREDSKNYLVANPLPIDYASSALAVRVELQADTTYHIAITYKGGFLTIYKNGVAHSSKQILDTIPSGLPSFSGYPYADETKAFRIGYAPAYITDTISQIFTLDEVAIYDTALTASEIQRHYIKMRDGYSDTTGGGGGGGTCDNTTLPELINEQDVTEYVVMDSLVLTRGDDNLVDVLSFNAVEEWGAGVLSDMFNANTYLIVERRYLSMDGTEDSGWESMGHFVCEGPYGITHDTTNRIYQISAKGLTKFLGFDTPVFTKIEPDKVLVSRREMEDVSTGVEYKSYKIPREGFTGKYYENFATFPTPKIWLSDFTLADDIVTAVDVIRAKGAEQSVQFLYGEGTFRIDSDYFGAKVQDSGMGAPDTLEIEAFRHLVPEDLADATISETIVTLDGLVPIGATIKIPLASAGIVATETYVGRTIFLTSGVAKGYMYRIVSFDVDATDYIFGVIDYTRQSIPDLDTDGVAVDDTIRIGDCNSPAQALTKIFKFAGFQNQDSTKPFYFEFIEPIFDGGITLIPQTFKHTDNKTWLQIVKEILDQCPGNYKLIVDREGVARTVNVIQKVVGSADHTLHVTSMEQDGSDYGIHTRIVALGQFKDPTDVGLSTAAGGNATYGTYKLDNFTSADPEGDTLLQAAADTIINQIANLDPKTPIGPASDDGQDTYGTIWRVFGTMGTHGFDCRRWSMEDSNLFWIDLGLNETSETQYLIESFEFQVFPVMFQVGTTIQQTLQLYYMTESDYISATGDIPPAASGDATVITNMGTLADSPAWRALTSEFVTGEGVTEIGASEFPDGEPVKMRFVKVVCGQPWHHPELDGTKYENTPISIIAMAGLRIYTSQTIIQTAELGVTPPFDTQALREKAERLRRRTMYLEENPYIQTSTDAANFALQELKEHYTEFEPIAIGAVDPTVELWDTVEFSNPETGLTQTFVVRSISLKNNEFVNMQIVDYTFFADS